MVSELVKPSPEFSVRPNPPNVIAGIPVARLVGVADTFGNLDTVVFGTQSGMSGNRVRTWVSLVPLAQEVYRNCWRISAREVYPYKNSLITGRVLPSSNLLDRIRPDYIARENQNLEHAGLEVLMDMQTIWRRGARFVEVLARHENPQEQLGRDAVMMLDLVNCGETNTEGREPRYAKAGSLTLGIIDELADHSDNSIQAAMPLFRDLTHTLRLPADVLLSDQIMQLMNRSRVEPELIGPALVDALEGFCPLSQQGEISYADELYQSLKTDKNIIVQVKSFGRFLRTFGQTLFFACPDNGPAFRQAYEEFGRTIGMSFVL